MQHAGNPSGTFLGPRPGRRSAGSAREDTPQLVTVPSGGVPDMTDTGEGFADALDDLASRSGPLAVDAERASGYRYTEDDYVIQMRRTGSQTYLFDVPAILASGHAFSEITERMPDVEWILHDGSQDLPSFAALGMFPTRLFDTEFSARFLNLPHAGLAAVTAHYLGKTLAKEHAAADWSYRPVYRDLRDYAALDVELLVQLRERMAADLVRTGKGDWARAEFDHILAKGLAPREPDPQPWHHLSHITSLKSDRRALAIAREMWRTRDRLARDMDICPQLLLKDSTIIKAAQLKPRNKAQFQAIDGLTHRVLMHTGTEQDAMYARYIPLQEKVRPHVWRDAIDRAMGMDSADLPDLDTQKIHDDISLPHTMKYWRIHQPDRYARLQAMRRRVAQIGQDVQIPPDLVIKPRFLKEACWQEVPSASLAMFLARRGARRWQVDLVSKSLAAISIS